MQASDQRVPEQTSISNVTINVIRDAAAPVFLDDPYFASVTENSVNGTSVYTASAVDPDLRVSRLPLGVEPEVTRQFILADAGHS